MTRGLNFVVNLALITLIVIAVPASFMPEDLVLCISPDNHLAFERAENGLCCEDPMGAAVSSCHDASWISSGRNTDACDRCTDLVGPVLSETMPSSRVDVFAINAPTCQPVPLSSEQFLAGRQLARHRVIISGHALEALTSIVLRS